MLRVLIVDDEPPSAEMLRLLLQKQLPLETITDIAHDVSTALNILEEQSIDLVFLDIVLKGESGFDLLDKILHRTFRFITLSAAKDYAFKTFEYGGSGYLLKPVNRDELVASLEHVLGKEF